MSGASGGCELQKGDDMTYDPNTIEPILDALSEQFAKDDKAKAKTRTEGNPSSSNVAAAREPFVHTNDANLPLQAWRWRPVGGASRRLLVQWAQLCRGSWQRHRARAERGIQAALVAAK